MRRRDFVAGLGSAAAWPVVARAQQAERMRRIGVLMPSAENDPAYRTRLSAFMQALEDLGWADGRQVRMDLRWAGGDNNRMRALAQELVGLQPDDKHDPGDSCPPAGDADDPDRCCDRGRSRQQWPRRPARSPEWEHYRLCHRRILAGRQVA
jgi:hypothetical protein